MTAVDENNVIVVKEIADNETNRDIDKYARAIEELLVKDGIKDVHISYGTNVKEIKEVSRSYKEAKMALDVGKIFFADTFSRIFASLPFWDSTIRTARFTSVCI